MSKTASESGKLIARFVTDPAGRPEFTKDKDGLKHYWIDLVFEPARSADVEGVTFVLDQNTYHDPIRLVDADTDFTERISSYGDFPVIAKVEADDFATLTGTLHHMLRRGHPESERTPEISAALADIAKN